MSKKLILIISLVVLVAGGAAVYFFWLRPSGTTIFTNVYIERADEFVAALTNGDDNKAYAMLSSDRQANYDETYWKQEFFPLFAGYSAKPIRLKAEQLKVVNDNTPPLYPPGYDPWQFSYQFELNKLLYKLDFTVIKQDDQLKIDAIHGSYQEPGS